MEADALDQLRLLRERIDKECPNSMGWRVVSLLESLKVVPILPFLAICAVFTIIKFAESLLSLFLEFLQ